MVFDVSTGVKIQTGQDYSVLFGCPPEVIKFIINKGMVFPDYLVIPDTIERFGILQNCTEFPLYYFLFVLGQFFKGKKLTIIGNADELQRNRELLKLTLLGPSMDEYRAIDPKSQYFEELYKESRFCAVKDKNGNEIPIDGFIDFVPFDVSGIAQTKYFTVKHLGTDSYEIAGEHIDIAFEQAQYPAYDLKTQFIPLIPQRFGIDVLGGGSGFTPLKPSSAVILNYNSDCILVDCMAYVDQHCESRGIAKRQIKSLFLTHIHDDHCNMFPLVRYGDKIKFLGTKEIYWMAMKKLALQTDLPIEEFMAYFDFCELVPFDHNDFFGLDIVPHYTVHSIPTIGATFSLKHQGKNHSVGYGGDNKSRKDIDDMCAKGIVSQKKSDYLRQLYNNHYDLFFADGGLGILHGDPEDSLKSHAERIIFLHLENLPAKFDAIFSMAEGGKRYTLVEADSDAYIIKTMEILREQFPGMSPDWSRTLLSSLQIVTYNAGDVIFRQGSPRNGSLYVIITGICSVMFHDGKQLREIAHKEAGGIIGEMSLIRDEATRSASVVAKTPVTLCSLEEQLFLSFVAAEDRVKQLKKMWEIRSALEKHYPFSFFSDNVKDRLARNSVTKNVKIDTIFSPLETSLEHAFILLSGSVAMKSSDGYEAIIDQAGSCFGSLGIKDAHERFSQAEYRSLTDSQILVVPLHAFEKIINKTPILRYYIYRMLKRHFKNPHIII